MRARTSRREIFPDGRARRGAVRRDADDGARVIDSVRDCRGSAERCELGQRTVLPAEGTRGVVVALAHNNPAAVHSVAAAEIVAAWQRADIRERGAVPQVGVETRRGRSDCRLCIAGCEARAADASREARRAAERRDRLDGEAQRLRGERGGLKRQCGTEWQCKGEFRARDATVKRSGNHDGCFRGVGIGTFAPEGPAPTYGSPDRCCARGQFHEWCP